MRPNPPPHSAPTAALLAALFISPSVASACGLALLLGVDVSSSISKSEYALQTRGHAAAFRDADVRRQIKALGGVAVALFEWSGPQLQQVRVAWTPVRSDAEAEALAARLEHASPPAGRGGTAVGAALQTARRLFRIAPECERRVFDISGDGVSNRGPASRPERDKLVADGVTVNGLAVFSPIHDVASGVNPLPFFKRNVIGGPGAFLEVADGVDDYPRAFKKKLLQELTPPILSQRRPAPAQTAAK